MKLLDELLPGAWLVELNCLKDGRGSFTKTYVADVFRDMGIPFNCEHFHI
jgi:dTDP-4-dehydrorhamnose 3,5-epimerase-like enzyme